MIPEQSLFKKWPKNDVEKWRALTEPKNTPSQRDLSASGKLISEQSSCSFFRAEAIRKSPDSPANQNKRKHEDTRCLTKQA